MNAKPIVLTTLTLEDVSNEINKLENKNKTIESKIDQLISLFKDGIKQDSNFKRILFRSVKNSEIIIDKNHQKYTDTELAKIAAFKLIKDGNASISAIQRKFKIGYSRAGRIMDRLESLGIVEDFQGSKARKFLVDISELENLF